MHYSTIERAYQLAGSGEMLDVLHIKMKLSAEGYHHIDAHLDGPSIRRELRRLIATAPRRRPAKGGMIVRPV